MRLHWLPSPSLSERICHHCRHHHHWENPWWSLPMPETAFGDHVVPPAAHPTDPMRRFLTTDLQHPAVLLPCRVKKKKSKGKKSRNPDPKDSLLSYHKRALRWAVTSALHVLLSEQERTIIWGRGEVGSLKLTLFKTEGSNSNIQSLGDDTFSDRDNIP